jgi:hypothetical protein
MKKVQSADGTTIAFDQLGNQSALAFGAHYDESVERDTTRS